MPDNKRPGYRSKPGEFDGDESHREEYDSTPKQPLPAISPYGPEGESDYSGTGNKRSDDQPGKPRENDPHKEDDTETKFTEE